MKWKLLIIVFFLLDPIHAKAGANDSLTRIEKQLEETFHLLEKWTEKNAKKFQKSLKETLDDLGTRLKGARKNADEKVNRSLDKVEEKLKDLNKRMEELGKENPPNQEKARELQGDVKKVSEDLDRAEAQKGK